MRIEAAQTDDIEPAALCMAEAFGADPALTAFFADSPLGRMVASTRFFGFLLEARLALGYPALVARDEGRVIGLAMGKDTTAADWPDDNDRRWKEFEALHSGLSDLFSAYDAIVESAGIDSPHYYLGVLGVSRHVKGTGVGARLMRAFLDLSDSDPLSQGTQLETANPANLDYYRRFGFEERASGALGAATLWVMHRAKPPPAA